MLVRPSAELGGMATLDSSDAGPSTWLDSSPAAEQYLQEVARTLRRPSERGPGGTFFLVSLGTRKNREPLLSAVRDSDNAPCFAIHSEELFDATAHLSSWSDDYRVYVVRRL